MLLSLRLQPLSPRPSLPHDLQSLGSLGSTEGVKDRGGYIISRLLVLGQVNLGLMGREGLWNG